MGLDMKLEELPSLNLRAMQARAQTFAEQHAPTPNTRTFFAADALRLEATVFISALGARERRTRSDIFLLSAS